MNDVEPMAWLTDMRKLLTLLPRNRTPMNNAALHAGQAALAAR
jgi:hypothetical protein